MIGHGEAVLDAEPAADTVEWMPRNSAVGLRRFLGKSANRMPLSVNTV